MSYRTSTPPLLVVVFLLVGCGVLWAQTSPTQPLSPSQDLEGLVRPETVAARKAVVQERLEALRQSNLLRADQAALSNTAVSIEQELGETANPTEAMQLAVHLEIVEIRQGTAHYQQQRSHLSDEMLAQEKRNAQEKQDLDRLASLVEKYASEEGVAQRLSVAFERLQRERARYRDTPIKTAEARLSTLTEQMLELDDRLYEFDGKAEARLATLTTALQGRALQQRDADIATIRKVLDEQKAALREQQQELAALVQETTRLLALHREHKRLLGEEYRFVLTKMFWRRSVETLGWSVVRNMVSGVVTLGRRLYAFAGAEQEYLRASLFGAMSIWLPGLLVLPVLLWIAYRVRQGLQHLASSILAAHAQHQTHPGATAAVLLGLQSAIWPALIVLVAWARGQLFPESSVQEDLASALLSALQVSALILWIGLLGHALLRPDGWGQRFWELDASLCHFLRWVVTLGCLGAFLCLVPRHVLLSAPGDAAVATGSLALARLLFLAFQSVILVLVGFVGRRGSPLMGVVLARSRQENGFLWRIWPLVYVVLLGGVVAMIMLDALGYGSAAQYLWSRVLQSLVVLLVLQLLVRILALRALQRLLRYVFSFGGHLTQPSATARAETARRAFTVVRTVCNTLSALLTAGMILEVWGVSVTSLLISPWGFQLLTRAIIIAIAIGLIVGVVQVSNALIEYLLQPKSGGRWGTFQESRKLRTLLPLTQTLIRVGATFVATLVILEQLGVATGPLIAGVGIFGLAVGFASQSLIKDVINGLFLLFEDSLSVGDIVVLRGTGGQVEKVTLRAVTIRDLSGSVHVIPNSSIETVTNMTKRFSCYVLDVGIAYHEDVDEVMAVLREIDEGLRREPEYSRDILEPLEIMGLDRFAESAVIIRARVKTRPMQQWRIGREFNRRIKKTFDERGIEMPLPSHTLYWGVPKAGVPPAVQMTLEGQESHPCTDAAESDRNLPPDVAAPRS